MVKKLEKKLEKKLGEFEHIYNPQHLYCRIEELGINKQYAKKIIRQYELNVYSLIIKEVRKDD